MTLSPHVEMALGADLSADPTSWTWTDLTARTQANQVTITRGRAEGGQQAQPGSMPLTLDNGDGALTPRLVTSPYWPLLARGTPVRHYVSGGTTYLALDGSTTALATTPDVASLDIVGDLFVACEFQCPVRLNMSTTNLSARWVSKRSGTTQTSWSLGMDPAGTVTLFWSADGTATLFAQSTRVPPFPDAGPLAVAVHLDVDNGTSGHTVRFWAMKGTVAQLEAQLAVNEVAVRLCDPLVTAGTTSIFASTADLVIGRTQAFGSTGYAWAAGWRRLRIRSGDWTGTKVADPDFTAQAAGVTSFADTAATPKTWTLSGSAAITDRRVRFVGQLNGNLPTWPGNGVASTAQVAWDVQGVLRRMRQGAKPLASPLRRRIGAIASRTTTVDGYWPLEDGADAVGAASAFPGGPMMTVTGDRLAFAANSSYDASGALPTWSDGNGAWSVAVPAPAVAPANPNWAVDMFFRIDTPPVSPIVAGLQNLTNTGTSAEWTVTINDTAVIVAANRPSAFGLVAVVSTSVAVDPSMFGGWVLLRISETQNGANVDWGVTVLPISNGVGFGPSGSFAGTVGRVTRLHNEFVAPTGGISVGHMAITHDQVLGWFAPADTAYFGEPATNRAMRLCQEQGIQLLVDGVVVIPSGWSTRAPVILPGLAPMGPQTAKPLLDLLQECADVDGGVLGESRELLALTFRSAASLANQTAALSLTNEVTAPFAPTDDDQGLVNSATVTRTGGSAALFADQSLIDDQGLYEDSRSVNVWADSQAADTAAWWVHEATWPDLRVPTFTAELAKTPAKITDWCAAAIGDVVAASALPVEYPGRALTQIVDGYAETISPFLWTVAVNSRPAGPWVVGVTDDDTPTTTLARVDTDGSTLGAAVNTSATSIQLASSGRRWTTAAAQMPFDIVIDGEQMTVTAIAAGGITHGADGTAAHASNASVTPGLPAATVQGNLLLLLAAIRSINATVDTPAGWTRLVDLVDTASAAIGNVAVFAQVAPASPAAPTVTFTGGIANDTTSAQLTRFVGNFSSPANALVQAHHILSPSQQDIPIPNLQPPFDGCLIIWPAWKGDDWTSVAALGFTVQIGAPSSTLGSDQGIVWDYQVQTTATMTPAGVHSVTGGAAAISSAGVIAIAEDVQVATVTRSVNGVVKSHAAGAMVTLASPLRSSLG